MAHIDLYLNNPHLFSSIDASVKADTDAGADARCGQGLNETNFIVSDSSKWIFYDIVLYFARYSSVLVLQKWREISLMPLKSSAKVSS